MANHVIRDRIWESRKIRSLSKAAALAYPWIFLVADDHGRFEYNPRRIWSLVFGNRDDVTLEEVSYWLDEYWRAGLLKRYHIDGELAVWEGFKGRKASERRASDHPNPDGMPLFQPPPRDESRHPATNRGGGRQIAEIVKESGNQGPDNDLGGARDKSLEGAENRGGPRQIDPRAEIEQSRDRAETERSSGNGDGALILQKGVPEEHRPEYAAAVWSAFLAKTGESATRPQTPAEWNLMRKWLDGGYPLRVVLRGIEESKGIGRRLGYYESSVEVVYERQQLALSGTR